MRSSGQHIRALTGVRFFAALWVVLYHSTRHNSDLLAAHHPDLLHAVWPVVGAGVFGVDLFFMLSGFVLALNYLDQLGDRFDLRATGRFLWLRLARIWPLYLLVVVAAGGLRVLRHGLWSSASADPVTWPAFVRQALMVQKWFPPERGPDSWFGPAWSLSAEWLAYLCFPLLVLLVARFRARLRARTLFVLAGLAMVPFLAAVALRGNMGGHNWVLRILCEFTAGMLLCAGASRLDLTDGVRRLAGLGAVASVVAVVVWLQVAWAVAGDGWWLSWVVAFFVPFLLGLALGTGPLHDALATRLLVLGGGLSYALYLVHSPLLYLFRDVVRFTGLLHLEPWPAYLAEVAFVPVMVLLAWGLYRFFEEPVRRRMVRLLGPATLVTTATVVPPPADDRQQETSRT